MKNKKLVRRILPFAIISAIGIFGLVSTTSLIVKARNSSDFDVIASVVQYLPQGLEKPNIAGNSQGLESVSEDLTNSENVTIIGTSRHFWILQYVFDKLDMIINLQTTWLAKKHLRVLKTVLKKFS